MTMYRGFKSFKGKNKKGEGLLQKAVLTFLMTGVVAWPSFSPVYAASTITDSNGASLINTNDAVHNIYAQQKVNANIGANKFQTFNVDTGNIANMHFRTSNTSTEYFNTLLNFVDNQINIKGTVNAICNGKVGGHLYFLSPNGMLVGAGGVINTGSLTVLTPTDTWWNNKYNGNITTEIVGAVSAMAVPINASGTIAIQGRVNATDDIRMKAGKINVGMDGNGSNKTAAQLVTGTTDFTSLVNMDSTELSAAGLTNLTASRSEGTGDVVLTAEVSYNENTGVDTVNAEVNIAGGSQITAVKNVTIDAKATNNVGVTVYVDNSNEARYKVGDKDLSRSEFEAQYKNSSTGGLIGSTATLNAKVNISDAGTNITGEVVHIGAEAKNVVTNTFTSSVPSAVTSTIFGVLLNGLDVAYGVLATDAEVNVGIGTQVVAKSTLDKALAVIANAETSLTLGTMDFSLAALTAANPNANLFPAVAFNYGSAENDAKVNVAGTLTAEKGGMAVEAVAKNTINSSASTGLGGVVALSEGAFNFGINIVNGHNRSKVTVADGATVTAKENLLVQADAISSINVTTNLTTDDKAATAFLVNTFEYDNQAEVDVNTTLTSNNGDVTVNANATYTDNTFTGNASVGKGFLARTVGDVLSGSQVISKGIVANIGNGISAIIGRVLGVEGLEKYGNYFDKLSEYGLGDKGIQEQSFADKLHSKIELGLSFAYMDEKNISLVDFGSKGKIVAHGQANVNAVSKLDDVLTALNGASKNASTRLDVTNPNALANGALFMRGIENQADVIFEAPANNAQETISVGSNVNINAKAEAPFNRVNRMKNTIDEFGGLSESDFKASLGDLTDSEKNVLWNAYHSICQKDLADLKVMFDANGNLKPEYTDGSGDYNKIQDVVKEFSNKTDVARFLDLINTGKFTYTDNNGREHTITLADGQKGFFSKVGSLFSFASPSNYTNYAVSALTSGQDNSHGGASSYALAIGVGIDSVENMARIQIGKNNKVNSTGGNITMNANTIYGGVALDGSYFPVGGGESGTGGFVVGVHHLNNNSIVAVAEKVQIVANQRFSAEAENDVLHIGLGLGLGMSKENTIAGTVQYVGADSNTLISIDDEAVLDADTISLLGDNDTTAVTITGGMAMGNTSAVGVAVGVLNIDRNNLVAIGDNDAVGTMTAEQMEIVTDDEADSKTRDDAETRLRKLIAKKSGLADVKRAAVYGSTGGDKGTIGTNGLDVRVVTNGHIVNVTADAGISMFSNEDAAGIGGKIGTFFSNQKNRATNLLGRFDSWIYGKFGGNSTWIPNPTNQSATNPQAGEQLPSFSLSATGSVAVSDVDVKTAAVVDNTNITFKDNAIRKLNVQAADNSGIVAVAGGMAFAWKTNTAHPDVTGKSGSFAGGAAVNIVQSDVDAIIQNSTINGATEIDNTAERSGSLAAAGAAVDISLNTGTSAAGMAAGISVNLAENKTIALMKSNTVNDIYAGTDKTVVNNIVTDKDLQVTGALNINAISGNKNTGSIGVSATWDSVNNTIKAEMDGGTYNKLGAVTDKVVTDLTQINAALGLGVSKGTGGSGLAWGFEGSLLVDVFKNVAEADVKNIISMNADSLDVRAYDTNLGTNDFDAYLSARGFDTKGTGYLNDAKTGAELEEISDHGNLIVTASTLISAAAGGTGGSGSFGAGVVVNEIDNDFLASVDNSTITLSGTDGADVFAESNTLAVSVAAGGAGTTKGFCAAGSFVMDFLNNDVYAKVLNSTIDTADLDIDAFQKNKIVNVAGQISVGRSAIGLDFAYNWMNTNTGAYLTNTKVLKTGGETEITLDAENTAQMYAVSVGVEVNTDGGLTGNGSVAVNRGHNNVEAAAFSNSADKNIVNAKALSIHSKDDSKLVAAAGGLELGGAVAIGGALTWNRIGDLEDVNGSTHAYISDGKIQVNRASLKGYTVSTTVDGTISVQAEDEADMTTISVGVGLTNRSISVQGANANAYLDKETSAAVEDSYINKGTGNSAGGKVSVLANTDNDLTTTAAVLSVGTWAAVGAGLAENTIHTDTAATLAGGQYALKDLLVKADSDDYLLNVAIGVAALAKTISVAGSLVFNEIVNETTATLGKDNAENGVTEVSVTDNVAVLSESEEEIVNHSGQFNLSGGKAVGAGLAVSSNEIGGEDNEHHPTGNTKAVVQNAKIEAEGKGNAVTVQDCTTVYDEETKQYGTWSGKGVVVNADALHLLTNDTFSGGLSVSLGDDALAIGLGAVTGVDRINGITLAKVYSSNINEDATGSALTNQNLSVRATDRVDSTAVISNAVADIAPGIGVTGSVGVGVSKDIQQRQVEAVVEGTAERNKVNAKNITLFADSVADLTVVNTAVSVSFAIGISGSVTTGVCYTDLQETTKATMKNVISYNDGLNILAKHEDNLDVVGTGVTLAINPTIYSGGAAVGVHVDSESNTSTTEATLEDSTVYHYTDNIAEDSIKAENVSDVLTQDANLSVSFSMLSVSVGVMVQDNDLKENVKTTVKNSTIGTNEKRAKNIMVASDNKLTTHFTNQNVSGGMVGIGVGVGLNTVDMVTLTNITNSTLYSRNNIVTDARENISLNGTMVQATAGALSIGVSTLHNYVNTTEVETEADTAVWETVKDEKSADNTGDGEYTAGKIDALAKQAVDDGNATLTQVNTDSKVGKNNIAAGTKTVRTKQVVTLPNSGTKVNLSGANLYAGGNITTTAKSTVNSDTVLGGGSLGIVNIQVEVNKQRVKGDVGVNVTGGIIDAGGNITLNALMDGLLKNKTVQASVSGAGILVTYSNVTKEAGGTAITLDSAKMDTKQNITLLSEDTHAIDHLAVGASVAVLTGSGYDISSVDKAVSKITVQNTLDNAGTPIYTQLSGNNILMQNCSKPAVKTKVVAADVSIASGSGVIAESNSQNQALMTVTDGVKLLGDVVTLDNGVNNQTGKYTLDADVTGVSVSGVAVHVNKARTYSDIKAETTVGAITLKTKDGMDDQGNHYTVGISDFTVNAFDATNIHNDIRGVTVGVLAASGSNFSQSDLKSTVSATINAGTIGFDVGKLTVTAKGNDKLNSVANGDGGGIVNISPVAAKVESEITGTTTTTLTGKFNIADDISAEAMRTDDLTYLAKAVQATIAGASGTELEIKGITENTTTNLNNVTLNVSGKTDISAHTAVNVNDDNSYAVRGNGVGGISVQVSDLTSTMTLNNKVNVANSKIFGNKNVNLSAYTDGYINLANYDYAVSVLFTGALADTSSTITANDEVNVTGTSEIRTEKAGSDVNIAAYDDLELYFRSYAEVASGLASGVSTLTTSNLTRNNKISLADTSILFSTQDINLLAGKKSSSVLAEMNMNIQAETYSGGLISLTNDPRVANTINQNNRIDVAAGTSSQSIRHTNLYAGNGRESIRTVAAYHSLWSGGDEKRGASYVSTTAGGLDGAVNRGNMVTVNGSVTAGIANIMQIDIGTTAGDWVILDPAEKAMVIANGHPVWGKNDKSKFIHLKDSDGNDNTAYFATLGITLDDFVLGSENVVETLGKRLEDVGALMDAYKDDANKTVYNGLQAEATRLENLIKQMGTDTSTTVMNSPRRDYIEIPDLVASGGNVVVETGDFNGSGSVTAKGNPSITINNYTNLALVTNSIVVDDPGGIVYYNGKELNPGDVAKTMQQQVQELNVNTATAVTLALNAAKGSTAGVIVNGIYNSGNIGYSNGTYSFIDNIPVDVDKTKIYFKVYTGDVVTSYIDGNKQTVAVKEGDQWYDASHTPLTNEQVSKKFVDAQEQTETIAAGSYDPMADVLVHGNIMAPKGTVTVHTNTKDIIVEGKTAKDAVVISGKIVSLQADNGSITQGFTDGIVNIGGTPKDQYATLYNQAKSEMYNAAEGTKKEYDLITGSPADGEKAPEPQKDQDGNVIGNWIAGGQVYINATDININGVIQSGYETFKADITEAQQQRINDVTAAWKNNGAAALTDTEVKNSGITYRVVEGGAYWNATKQCYDYVVDVYYNPYTGKLVTADVNANGGKVYLTGRISSTGNGKIICLDGAYDININNALNYGLNVGNLIVNDTQGLIQITDANVTVGDKQAALVTEIRNGSVKTYNSLTKEEVSNEQISGSGRSYTYNPLSGLRYNWMTGYKSTSYKRYTETTMDKWWGAMDGTPTKADLDAWESGMQPIEEGTTGVDTPREQGIYISNASGSTSAGMTVLHSKTEDESTTTYMEGAPRKWSTGYLGCHKWVQYTWRTETGSKQYDYASVNASNPIAITFIGKSADDAHVNITSAQDINLGGVVGNTQLYEIKNGDVVTNRIEKGTVNIQSQNGSVVQNSVGIYGAAVNLSAKNDLKNITIVAGDSVDFTGVINGVGVATVTVDNNYQAKGDVVLHNFGGTKANGASLTATGNIRQAASSLVQASRIDLISENGAITGLNGNTAVHIQGGQTSDVVGSDTMLASVNAQAKGDIYLEQDTGDLRVGTIYSDNGDVIIGVPDGGIIDALPYESRTDRISDDELLAQWRQMGMIAGGDADLIAEKQKVLKKVQGDDATYQLWNSDQLLYSIQDKIINRDSGVVVPTNGKAVNFYGKNITMLVKDSAGLNSENVREVNLLTLGEVDADGYLTHLDDLKALSTADASTVEWRASENKAFIRERMAIGLQQPDNTDGAITIVKYTNEDNGQSNIFVESRQRKDLDAAVQQNYDMRLYMAYTTQGDVQFNTWGNLYNVMDVAGIPVILGKNIVINTGAEGETAPFGSIGTADKPMTIALGGGNLAATATGNIYLANDDANPLKIASMTAGKSGGIFSADSGNIHLTSTSDIYLIKKDSNIQGFIRTNTDGLISIHSDESIGSANNPVRILNSDTDQGTAGFATNQGTISLTAGAGIYVEGVSTEPYNTETMAQRPGGYLNLAKLRSAVGDVVITLNGDLNLGAAIDLSQTSFTLNINEDANITQSITAKDIFINAQNSIALAEGITLRAEKVALTAGRKIALTYGTIAKSETPGGLITQGQSSDYINVTGRLNRDAAFFDNISSIQANQLTVTASQGILLGGKNDCNNVALYNAQNEVIYHNVADEDPGEIGDILNVAVSNAYNSTNPVAGSVWIYNEAAEQFAKTMTVETGIYALGNVSLRSDSNLVNQYEIASIQGGVYLDAGYDNVKIGNLENYGSITAGADERYSGKKVEIFATGSLHNHKRELDGGQVTIYGEQGVIINAYQDVKNEAEILSSAGNVELGSWKDVINEGSIQAEQGYVAICANAVNNFADIEAGGSIFLLSNSKITNRERPVTSQGQFGAANRVDVHMYAGDDIVLMTKEKLDNRAELFAGMNPFSLDAHGGDVFMDDCEVLDNPKMAADTKQTLTELLDKYWDRLGDFESGAVIENKGVIMAMKGDVGNGLVHLDSQGYTVNDGTIYSVNGDVLLDSTGDLTNNLDIYVINTKEDGSSCDVTLQATGNVYNTGDIYVAGKGQVTLDADSVDQDALDNVGITDYTVLSQDQLKAYKKVSTITLLDDEGNPAGTKDIRGVYNTGDIYASDGDVTFKSMYGGDIYNTDALIDDSVIAVGSIVYSQGSIALLAPMGHITNTKALYATKNITIECVDDLYNAPAEPSVVSSEYGGHTILRGLEAGAGEGGSGDLKLISHSGVIYNDGILKATRGDVIVDAGGARVFNDVVFEIDDTICPVPLNGKTKFENEFYSIINTKHGDVMVADGNIVIHGQSGVLTLGDMYALHQHVDEFTDPAQSQVDFMKAAENIEKYATGIAEGKGNISLISDVGDVFVYSVRTSVRTDETSGEEIVEDIHDPNGHWFLSAQDFTLKATGSYDAQGHEIGGFVYNDKGLKADFGSINMTYGMGINVGCAIESIHKDVTIKTTRGSAVIASAIKAGSYINLEVGRSADDKDYGKDDVGTLVILDNPETGTSYLQANDGITMQAADSIFIRDKEGITTDKLLRLYAFGDKASDLVGEYYDEYYSDKAGIYVEGNMKSVNGDIDIGLQHGNLTLSNAEGTEIYDIVAHNGMNSVGTHDADIIVDNLEGNQIILYAEMPEANADFNTLTVGDKLVLAVNDLYMDMRKVIAYDRDNPYEMDIYTVGNPVDAKICLDYSKCDVENIEIQQMNVGQAEVIANAPVKIDELSVANRADIYAMGTKTSVYGFMHEYDAANDITYYNEGKGGVGVDLSDMFFGKDAKQDVVTDVKNNLWKYETGATGRDGNPKANTMALDIMTAKSQRGDGILLAKDRGYSVYGQRYSVESVMQDLLSMNIGNVFNTTFNNNIQFFNRFDNVVMPEVVVNAPEEWDKDQFEF